MWGLLRVQFSLPGSGKGEKLRALRNPDNRGLAGHLISALTILCVQFTQI